jgi:hypothetical protein
LSTKVTVDDCFAKEACPPLHTILDVVAESIVAAELFVSTKLVPKGKTHGAPRCRLDAFSRFESPGEIRNPRRLFSARDFENSEPERILKNPIWQSPQLPICLVLSVSCDVRIFPLPNCQRHFHFSQDNRSSEFDKLCWGIHGDGADLEWNGNLQNVTHIRPTHQENAENHQRTEITWESEEQNIHTRIVNHISN